MIVEVVRTLLLAESTITDLVGDRVYPLELPDAPSFPALVITKAAGVGEYDLQGDAGVESARVQVDVHTDEGYAACVALKKLVRRFLSGFKGGTPGNPCQVQSVFCINDFDLNEPASERAGPRMRRRVLEFEIWSQEV